MRRGTTPTHIFNMDLDLTAAEVIYITYKQGCGCQGFLFELTDDRITRDINKLTVTLTQGETLAFAEAQPVYIQIRARFGDGEAVASNIIKVDAREILKDGVI